jgi:hypothetical protein
VLFQKNDDLNHYLDSCSVSNFTEISLKSPGFVVFVSTTMAYRSLNPMWEFDIANSVALGFGVLGALLHILEVTINYH